MIKVDEKNLAITDGKKTLYYEFSREHFTVDDIVTGNDYTIDDSLDHIIEKVEDHYEEFEDGIEDSLPEEERRILNEVDKILNGEKYTYSKEDKISILKSIVNHCENQKMPSKRTIENAITDWLNEKHGINLFNNKLLEMEF